MTTMNAAAVSATPAQTTTSAGASSRAAIGSDFQTFLRMLTAQIQNQDPMNPMDSSEFAVQLATFSGVEQQVKTNEILGNLAASLTQGSLGGMASLVGMEAQIPGPLPYSGAPLTLSAEPEPGADQAVLVVTDASGSVVQRQPVALGSAAISWSGESATGQRLPDGLYRFRLESFRAGQPIGAADASGFAEVREVSLSAGDPVLRFDGGLEVPADQVTALRKAGG